MNLGIVSPNPNDVSSWVRAFGALGYLSRQYPEIHLVAVDATWPALCVCDAVFIHRAWNDAHFKIADMSARMNIPVWLDYDDHVLAMNPDNPAYKFFMNQATHEIVKKVTGTHASVITVSTNELVNVFPGAMVIPNAFNDYVWKFEETTPKKVISWRGGSSHTADVDAFLPAMQRVAADYPDWDWHFFGDPHWKLYHGKTLPGDQVHIHEFEDVFTFMYRLKECQPAIHIVPLLDTPFNRCKSNCSWIEASYAGAITIAPNWEEFRRPGIWGYFGPAEFEEVLRNAIMASPVQLQDDLFDSRAFIADNLLLSEVNKLRLQVLEAICPKFRTEKV